MPAVSRSTPSVRDVEGDRASRLVAVGETERTLVVRDAGDLGDVEPVAGAVRDRGAADERRALVDGLGEALERDAAVGIRAHVDDLRPPQLLRVCDLTDRGELELGDDDPVPPRLERERADETAHSLRDGGDHRNLLGLGPDKRAKDARATSARSTQCSHSAPCWSQPARYSSYASRTSTESAPCEQELAYVVCSKIGNARPDAGIDACVGTGFIVRGTPCGAPRAGGARTPCPRARSDPSRGRSHGRRSRVTRSRSAPR